MLTAFADALELTVWTDLDAVDAQAGQFADPQPGLNPQVQQESVTAPDPGSGVGGGNQRFGLGGNDTIVFFVRFAGIARTRLIVTIESGAR